MIPNHKLLRRAPLYSGISNSFYLPSHLISNVQPKSSGQEENVLSEVFEFSLKHIHEWTHWFQHAGTSIGLFFEFVRHSQTAVFMKWIKDQNKDIRSNIFSDRFLKNIPLIQLDKKGASIAQDGSPSDPLNFIIQAWYDHQFLHEMLLDSTIADEFGMIGSDGFSNVMADVVLFACGDMGFQSDLFDDVGHMGARRWYFEGETKFPLVAAARKRITTKSLMECAATIAELVYMQSNPRLEVDHTDNSKKIALDVERKLMNSEYGYPILAFSHIVSDSLFKGDNKIFSSLSAVIYAALNPPIPPLYIGPKEDGKSWEWTDIYPPFRFLELCKSVNRIGPLHDNPESKDIETYINSLCEVSGVPYYAFSELPSRPNSQDRTVLRAVEQFGAGATTNVINIHQELPLEAYAELKQHNRRYELVVTLGDCFNGERAPEFVEMVFDSKEPFDLLKAPLMHTPNGRIGYHGSKDFGSNLLARVIMSNGYYELACGSGKIDLSMFPNEVENDLQHWTDLLQGSVRRFWELET